ncbi:MAG: hypothetical protein DRJ29_07470 [Bacteroidetes bacterium]|nr:MAG: hypothetical protein DRI98_10485 [Bacteroidota bacterium]RLD93444.1 MAG: hypothetical protein DRJ13_15655 [Bacteroidota bacterium]RLD93916.1 MAG: hypothetical protein DRJ29_07470 [Bacteroidota bacterium]
MYDSIIPTADTIPVHWLWFQVLLIATFFIHMILMNLLLGGSLLTLWDLFTGKLEKRTSGSIPTLVALTVNFGVPPLLFVQLLYGHLFYSSSVMLAVPWILVVPILILAYYGAYIFIKKSDKAPVLSKGALIFTSVSLLYIAFIFVNNNTLALQPGRWGIYFEDPGGWNLNLGEPTLWSRYLHFLLAALAIGALGRAIAYHFSKTAKKEKEIQIRRNLKIFAWITVVQFAVGSWFWLTMPETVWKTFMGESFFATFMMVTGWLLALLILHSAFTGRLKSAMILGGLEVLNMVIVRDLARGAYLKDIFKPSQLENMGEPSALIVFLLIFAVGLLAIYYMIRLISKSKTPQS